ncbi:MAG: hypothetical protein K2X61_08210 [Caulobacteraceae bacterium]|nr:hypothetical protein [Caulobacteraceae bacterium]
MARRAAYALQPFVRRSGVLQPTDLLRTEDEAHVFRVGRAMAKRVAGLAFFKITTSAEGDEWAEVEVLCTDGDVPDLGS